MEELKTPRNSKYGRLNLNSRYGRPMERDSDSPVILYLQTECTRKTEGSLSFNEFHVFQLA